MVLPNQVAVMILNNATLFPQALLPLYIFEPRYREMLADALRTHRTFCISMQKPGTKREAPCQVAGLGVVRVSVDHSDGTSHLILEGLARVRLGRVVQRKPYRMHSIEVLQAPQTGAVKLDALAAKTLELVRYRLESGPPPFPFPCTKPQGQGAADNGECCQNSVRDILQYLEHLSNREQMADLVACALLPDAQQRQKLLETVDLDQRFGHLIQFLLAENRKYQNNSPA